MKINGSSVRPNATRRWGGRLALLGLAAALSACSGNYASDGTAYPDDRNRRAGGGSGDPYAKSQSVFGEDGLNLFGGAGAGKPEVAGGEGIGVNSFLWRASLDTISFMPLASADPFGGVIITDWHTPPDSQNERFKVNIFILGRELRADGVRTSVFRQVRDVEGRWVESAVEPKTSVDLENAILTRARELRIASLR